jgi:hypothetical protein
VSEKLMAAVAVLTDWRLVRTFECQSVVVQQSREWLYDLHAEPNYSSFVCTDLKTGRESSYIDATGERIDSGVRSPRQSSDLIWQPFPVRLAFPLSLPIWGRRHDGYRMVSANERSGQLIVQLGDRDDSVESGSLTIDLARGLAVRLDVPALSLEYRHVESAPSRLRGDSS